MTSDCPRIIATSSSCDCVRPCSPKWYEKDYGDKFHLKQLSREELEMEFCNLHTKHTCLTKASKENIKEIKRLNKMMKKNEEDRKRCLSPTKQLYEDRISQLEQTNSFLQDKILVLRHQLQSHSRLHAKAHRNTRTSHSSITKNNQTLLSKLALHDTEDNMNQEEKNSSQEVLNVDLAANDRRILQLENELAQHTNDASRVAENIELIRLRRLVKIQSAQLSSLTAHSELADKELDDLRVVYKQANLDNDQILKQLAAEKQRLREMQIDLIELGNLKQDVKILQEQVRDLQSERTLLRNNNDKLLEIASGKSEDESSQQKIVVADAESNESSLKEETVKAEFKPRKSKKFFRVHDRTEPLFEKSNYKEFKIPEELSKDDDPYWGNVLNRDLFEKSNKRALFDSSTGSGLKSNNETSLLQAFKDGKNTVTFTKPLPRQADLYLTVMPSTVSQLSGSEPPKESNSKENIGDRNNNEVTNVDYISAEKRDEKNNLEEVEIADEKLVIGNENSDNDSRERTSSLLRLAEAKFIFVQLLRQELENYDVLNMMNDVEDFDDHHNRTNDDNIPDSNESLAAKDGNKNVAMSQSSIHNQPRNLIDYLWGIVGYKLHLPNNLKDKSEVIINERSGVNNVTENNPSNSNKMSKNYDTISFSDESVALTNFEKDSITGGGIENLNALVNAGNNQEMIGEKSNPDVDVSETSNNPRNSKNTTTDSDSLSFSEGSFVLPNFENYSIPRGTNENYNALDDASVDQGVTGEKSNPDVDVSDTPNNPRNSRNIITDYDSIPFSEVSVVLTYFEDSPRLIDNPESNQSSKDLFINAEESKSKIEDVLSTDTFRKSSLKQDDGFYSIVKENERMNPSIRLSSPSISNATLGNFSIVKENEKMNLRDESRISPSISNDTLKNFPIDDYSFNFTLRTGEKDSSPEMSCEIDHIPNSRRDRNVLLIYKLDNRTGQQKKIGVLYLKQTSDKSEMESSKKDGDESHVPDLKSKSNDEVDESDGKLADEMGSFSKLDHSAAMDPQFNKIDEQSIQDLVNESTNQLNDPDVTAISANERIEPSSSDHNDSYGKFNRNDNSLNSLKLPSYITNKASFTISKSSEASSVAEPKKRSSIFNNQSKVLNSDGSKSSKSPNSLELIPSKINEKPSKSVDAIPRYSKIKRPSLENRAKSLNSYSSNTSKQKSDGRLQLDFLKSMGNESGSRILGGSSSKMNELKLSDVESTNIGQLTGHDQLTLDTSNESSDFMRHVGKKSLEGPPSLDLNNTDGTDSKCSKYSQTPDDDNQLTSDKSGEFVGGSRETSLGESNQPPFFERNGTYVKSKSSKNSKMSANTDLQPQSEMINLNDKMAVDEARWRSPTSMDNNSSYFKESSPDDPNVSIFEKFNKNTIPDLQRDKSNIEIKDNVQSKFQSENGNNFESSIQNGRTDLEREDTDIEMSDEIQSNARNKYKLEPANESSLNSSFQKIAETPVDLKSDNVHGVNNVLQTIDLPNNLYQNPSELEIVENSHLSNIFKDNSNSQEPIPDDNAISEINPYEETSHSKNSKNLQANMASVQTQTSSSEIEHDHSLGNEFSLKKAAEQIINPGITRKSEKKQKGLQKNAFGEEKVALNRDQWPKKTNRENIVKNYEIKSPSSSRNRNVSQSGQTTQKSKTPGNVNGITKNFSNRSFESKSVIQKIFKPAYVHSRNDSERSLNPHENSRTTRNCRVINMNESSSESESSFMLCHCVRENKLSDDCLRLLDLMNENSNEYQGVHLSAIPSNNHDDESDDDYDDDDDNNACLECCDEGNCRALQLGNKSSSRYKCDCFHFNSNQRHSKQCSTCLNKKFRLKQMNVSDDSPFRKTPGVDREIENLKCVHNNNSINSDSSMIIVIGKKLTIYKSDESVKK